MKKRLLAMLLVIVLAVSVVSLTASAADSPIVSAKFYWNASEGLADGVNNLLDAALYVDLNPAALDSTKNYVVKVTKEGTTVFDMPFAGTAEFLNLSFTNYGSSNSTAALPSAGTYVVNLYEAGGTTAVCDPVNVTVGTNTPETITFTGLTAGTNNRKAVTFTVNGAFIGSYSYRVVGTDGNTYDSDNSGGGNAIKYSTAVAAAPAGSSLKWTSEPSLSMDMDISADGKSSTITLDELDLAAGDACVGKYEVQVYQMKPHGTRVGEAITAAFEIAKVTCNGTADYAIVGTEYTLPAALAPSSNGYFKAWSINGTEYAPGAKITITGETTITPVWGEAISSVDFYWNSAEALEDGINKLLDASIFVQFADGYTTDSTKNTVTVTAPNGNQIFSLVPGNGKENVTFTFASYTGDNVTSAAPATGKYTVTLKEGTTVIDTAEVEISAENPAPALKAVEVLPGEANRKAISFELNGVLSGAYSFHLVGVDGNTYDSDNSGGGGLGKYVTNYQRVDGVYRYETIPSASMSIAVENGTSTIVMDELDLPADYTGKYKFIIYYTGAGQSRRAELVSTEFEIVELFMDVGSGNKSYVIAGSKYTLPAALQGDGSTFKAWEVNGTEYAPDTVLTITEDTTIHATWGQVVSFDANGGTGAMANVVAGEKYTLPANGFTAPEGKQFKAWKIGTTEYAPGAEITVEEEIVVTAVWEDIPVVPEPSDPTPTDPTETTAPTETTEATEATTAPTETTEATTAPTETTGATEETKPSTTPVTGDSTDLLRLSLIAVLSVAGMVLAFIMQKKYSYKGKY